MSKTPTIQYFAKSPEQTKILGITLARHFSDGELVFFQGDLGAGKSTLIRAIIQELMDQVDLDVPSPTFLLVLPYQNKNWKILHADLYRIEQPFELEELGLLDDPENLVFVEWPQKAQEYLPAPDLLVSLDFEPGETGRRIIMRSPVGSQLFSSLSQDPVFN